MAKNPTVRDLTRLAQANKELSDITSKLDHISQLNVASDTVLDKITGLGRMNRNLDSLISSVGNLNKRWADSLSRVHGRHAQIRAQLEALQRANHQLTGQQERQLRILNSSLTKYKILVRLVAGDLARAFDNIGKTILKMGIGGLLSTFNFLEDSLRDIFEYQERWTKALGKFSLSMGAASKNTQALTDAAVRNQGRMAALTGNFEESFQAIGEFTDAFGFVDSRMKGFVDRAWDIGRALGIGTKGAAEFQRALHLQGQTVDETNGFFGDMVRAADKAGVGLAGFGKEILQDKEFLLAFGKAGQKTFLNAAAFVKKLGLSLKSLREFTTMTDTFDSATESVAKLNTVFGTSINSLDLMLEQDPARRFEMVRQQIKGQVGDLKNLNRFEREFLAQTLKISQEELEGIINSGLTYDKFQKQQAKAQKQKENDERMVQRAVSKTAETLIFMQQQWDKVTVAVMKMVRPFTDALGLTEKGSKGTYKWGEVISRVFTKFSKFLEDISTNPEWKNFMSNLGRDLLSLGKKIEEIMKGPGLKEWLTTMIGQGRKFYDSVKDGFDTVSTIVKTILPHLKLVAENLDLILDTWIKIKAVTMAVGAAKGAIDVVRLASLAARGGAVAAGASATGGAIGGGGGAAGAAGAAAAQSSMLRRGLVGAKNMIVAGATKAGGALKSAGLFLASSATTLGPKLLSFGKTAITGVGSVLSSAAANFSSAIGKASGSLLGKLGLVGAAAAAGVAIGTWIRDLEIGGKKVDDWVQIALDGVSGFGDKLWKSFKESKFGKVLGLSDSFADLQKKMGLSSQALMPIEAAFSRAQSGFGVSDKDAKFLKEMEKVLGDDLIELLAKSRGISEGDVRKVFAGVPSQVSPKVVPAGQQPATVKTSASKTGATVGRAGGGGTTQVQVVAGDVILDGQKVGRHVLRPLITSQQG